MNELMKDRIAKKAYERFAGRGFTNGNDFDDWLQAEKEVFSESKSPISSAMKQEPKGHDPKTNKKK